jgi:hypothetical protein
MIAALETYVCSKKQPVYARFRAFTVLFKTWATMRQDDLQQLWPGRLRMLSDAVVGELMRTKTTGATKRVKEVPLIIATQASITGMPWLLVGMKLISEHRLFDRKYMLPIRGDPFGNKMARYAAASAATKSVTAILQRPRAWTRSANSIATCPKVVWDFTASEVPLLPLALVDFWTEHSPRAFMPSITGLLEVEKSTRDLLGRWSPTGSEDYTRTYRQMVKRLQLDVIKAIRANDQRLVEDDIWEKLPRYVAEHPEQCVGFDVPQFVARWKKQTDMFLNELSQKGHCQRPDDQEVLDDEVTFVDDGFGEMPVAGAATGLVALPVEGIDKPAEVMRQKKFVIIYSRNRKFARLHSTSSNCPWSKAEVFDSSEVDVALPEQYDARCKICYPTKIKDPESESDVYESDESANDA